MLLTGEIFVERSLWCSWHPGFAEQVGEIVALDDFQVHEHPGMFGIVPTSLRTVFPLASRHLQFPCKMDSARRSLSINSRWEEQPSMLLFGDNFWSLKTAIDLIAVIGLILTLFSIWLTWWLAKKDLEKRVANAQRETIDRLAAVLLQSDVTETGRCLREARELCRIPGLTKAKTKDLDDMVALLGTIEGKMRAASLR